MTALLHKGLGRLGLSSTRLSEQLLWLSGWLTALVPVTMLTGPAVPEILLVITCLSFLFHCLLANEWRWVKEPWFLLLLVLWVYLVVRGGFSQAAGDSVGRALPWIRYPLYTSALSTWTLKVPEAQQRLLKSLVLAAGFLVVDIIFQYVAGSDIIGQPIAPGSRLTGPFPRPRVGITLVWIVFPALFALRLTPAQSPLNWKNAAFVFFLCVVVGAVFLTGERMALLLCLAGYGLAVLLSRRLRWFFAAALLLCVGTLFVAQQTMPSVTNRQINQSSKAISNYWDTAYGQTVLSSIAVWSANPLTGVGLKNFRVVCPDAAFGPTTPEALHLRCPLHPHNIYFEWLAETGAIGFFLYFSAVAFWVWGVLKQRRAILTDPVLTGLTITAFIRFWPLSASTSQFIPWSATPFWLLIGFLLARINKPSFASLETKA